MRKTVIYIHGFNSSPASFKARLLREKLEQRLPDARFFAPALPPSPAAAARILDQLIGMHPAAALVGSSLGGYYATWFAERYRLRAALLNPAVEPYLLLAAALGRQKNLYTGEEYEFTQQHIDELRALEVDSITAGTYLLLTATGDEVLDYRRALVKYGNARQIVVDGSDHGLSDFERYVKTIVRFCIN